MIHLQARRAVCVSPLTEGRGLKSAHRGSCLCPPPSPLTEGRGLKSCSADAGQGAIRVAPHRGAWIEIDDFVFGIVRRDVAPHRGAWIEILGVGAGDSAFASPLTEGRGLKSREDKRRKLLTDVAPHRGAWIEIARRRQRQVDHGMSPLTEGRGLKRETSLPRVSGTPCRPSRRGVD